MGECVRGRVRGLLLREDAAKVTPKGGVRMVCTWDVACAWCAQGSLYAQRPGLRVRVRVRC